MPEWGHERTWLNAPHISTLQQPPHVHSKDPNPASCPAATFHSGMGNAPKGKSWEMKG